MVVVVFVTVELYFIVKRAHVKTSVELLLKCLSIAYHKHSSTFWKVRSFAIRKKPKLTPRRVSVMTKYNFTVITGLAVCLCGCVCVRSCVRANLGHHLFHRALHILLLPTLAPGLFVYDRKYFCNQSLISSTL